jgi:hypothetical protein
MGNRFLYEYLRLRLCSPNDHEAIAAAFNKVVCYCVKVVRNKGMFLKPETCHQLKVHPTCSSDDDGTLHSSKPTKVIVSQNQAVKERERETILMLVLEFISREKYGELTEPELQAVFEKGEFQNVVVFVTQAFEKEAWRLTTSRHDETDMRFLNDVIYADDDGEVTLEDVTGRWDKSTDDVDLEDLVEKMRQALVNNPREQQAFEVTLRMCRSDETEHDGDISHAIAQECGVSVQQARKYRRNIAKLLETLRPKNVENQVSFFNAVSY